MRQVNSYLDYPTDWTLEDNLDEAAEFVKDADLFVMQDALLDVEGLNLKDYCGVRNTIINGTGSNMRTMIPTLMGMQMDGWAVVPPMCDETLSTHLCSPPFENWIVPVERIEELAKGIEKNEKVSICHAPTATGIKGTEIIESILEPMIKSGEIEYKRITKQSWAETIKEKAKYHILLDSFGNLTQTYGAGNALEALVLGQTMVSKISPWAYTLHPDLPMVTTWMRNVEDVIRDVIAMEQIGGTFVQKVKARNWVREHFSAENQIQHWERYIAWVQER